METIKIYIDNVFAGFEQTEQVATLKRDMLISMEEKYFALKGGGKSENEAVGGVIADFGNIDEITAELGQAQPVPSDIPADSIPLSRDDAFDFIGQMKKSGVWIGIGVWLILIGVCSLVTVTNLEIEKADALGLFVLLTFVAGAVPIFIVHGMALSKFEVFETTPILLDSTTRKELESERKRFTPMFVTLIAVGVAVVLLAVGFFILMNGLSIFEGEIQAVPVALFLFSVGFAVFLFINAGMSYGAYEILLGVGEYSNKKASEKADRLIGTVAATFWPLMTAVYLLWSIVWGAWHISWIIWPVSGILFGAFAGGLSVWTEEKK